MSIVHRALPPRTAGCGVAAAVSGAIKCISRCQMILLLLKLGCLQATASLAIDTNSTDDTAGTGASPFLKPGSSYQGKSAKSTLKLSASTVAVLIMLDNWSRWSLVEPDVEVTCGKPAAQVPNQVDPGISEMVLFEKGPGFSGVCGVLTYRLDLPPKEEPHYVQVMWSVPYDYNTYNAYLAVGVAKEFLNSSSLFNELYYHSGPFHRVKAGLLAEYAHEAQKVKLRGTMQPDTYTPLVTVSVLPTDAMDSFQFAGQASNCQAQKLLVLVAILHRLYFH